MISKRGQHFTAIAILLGSNAVCSAQSHDLESPTPLAPGLNKGKRR
jgi:hypothetical protein